MQGRLLDGRYQIQRQLGEGGMGAVYEAVHVGTGRRVAVKVILGESLKQNREMLERFQREAKAAGSIDTHHIVQVFDAAVDPETGAPYIAMEYLTGGDLAQLLSKVGPLPPDLALRIAAQACIGLQRAHDAGVVHRDIKPANLHLSRREAGEIVVKLLDFGITKVRHEASGTTPEAHKLTRTGSMLGSPLYMSPAQAQSAGDIDGRTDVWSMGAVLYEMLTGRAPHQDCDSLAKLLLAIVSVPAPDLQRFAPWVDSGIAAIVHQALQIDVATRTPSAAAMLESIRALLPSGTALTEADLHGLPENDKKAGVAPGWLPGRLPKPPDRARSCFAPHRPHPRTAPSTARGARLTACARPRAYRTWPRRRGASPSGRLPWARSRCWLRAPSVSGGLPTPTRLRSRPRPRSTSRRPRPPSRLQARSAPCACGSTRLPPSCG